MSECRPPVAPPTVEGQVFDAPLAALRERGAQCFDPVRFRFIEALVRRAAVHGGDVRRILDVRLVTALEEYRVRLEAARSVAGAGFGGLHKPAATQDAKQPPGPLADLVRHIARHSSPTASGSLADHAVAHAIPPTELNALRDFRSTWARLRVDQQLSQSLAKGARNAGPLNSHLLVLRSLKLLQEISPAYLARFVSHVDALLWLDQANGGGAVAQMSFARSEGDKKRKPVRRRPA